MFKIKSTQGEKPGAQANSTCPHPRFHHAFFSARSSFPLLLQCQQTHLTKIRAFQSLRSEYSVSDYSDCCVCVVQVSEDRSIGRRKTEKQPWPVHQGLLAFTLHHPALPSVHLKFILFYFYLGNTLLVSIIKPIYLRQCALPQPHSNGKITFKFLDQYGC